MNFLLIRPIRVVLMITNDLAKFLIEYFSGIEKGDFYEEPVQGEYPDW